MLYSYNYTTLLSNVTIVTEDDFLLKIIFGNEEIGLKQETILIKKVKHQLDEYLMGIRKTFKIPLKMIGTDFQIKVWTALTNLKYGELISYQALAEKIKNKNYARAVGLANNKNPIPIIIPCHLVIGKDGHLVGYGGGIGLKEKLIEIEISNK